jgi:hypothetical protein
MSGSPPKLSNQAKVVEKGPKRAIEGFTQKKQRITARINNKYLTSPNKMIPNEKYLRAYIKDAKKKANSGQGNKVFLQSRYKNATNLLSRLEGLKANQAVEIGPIVKEKKTRRKRYAFPIPGEGEPVKGYFNNNGIFRPNGAPSPNSVYVAPPLPQQFTQLEGPPAFLEQRANEDDLCGNIEKENDILKQTLIEINNKISSVLDSIR